MLLVRCGDSPPQQTGSAWSLSSVVLGVPGYITLTGRLLLSLLRVLMTHYLVQSPILPVISSMSFSPNIPTIYITLDQGPTVSNSLPSMMIIILLTECFLDRPILGMCMTVEFTIFYSLNCCIRIILYFMLLCFFNFLHHLFIAAFCHLYFIQ